MGSIEILTLLTLGREIYTDALMFIQRWWVFLNWREEKKVERGYKKKDKRKMSNYSLNIIHAIVCLMFPKHKSEEKQVFLFKKT